MLERIKSLIRGKRHARIAEGETEVHELQKVMKAKRAALEAMLQDESREVLNVRRISQPE